MPITLADIPLTPPNNAQAIVDQFYHTHRIEEFEHPGYYGVPNNNTVPIPYPPKREPPRIGCLSWPTGASRWATCHLVCTDAQLTQIRAAQTLAINTTTVINGTPVSQSLPLTLSDGSNTVATNMWLLPPRPIQQRGQGQDWYLLTLVDDRWWWWQQGNGDILDLQGGTTGQTWNDYLVTLLSALNIANYSIVEINTAYGSPSLARWSAVDTGPIPPILDAVCKTVGLRLIRNLDGSVSVQNYATAANQDAVNWAAYQNQVLAGGQFSFADIANNVPESVTLLFSDPSETIGDGSDLVTLFSLGLEQYGESTGVAGWSAQVFVDPSGNFLPSSYGIQSSIDYYLWALSVTDCSLRGLIPRAITGLDYSQEWMLQRDGQYITRVSRMPFGDRNVYGGLAAPPLKQSPIYKYQCSNGNGYNLISYDGGQTWSVSSPEGCCGCGSLVPCTADTSFCASFGWKFGNNILPTMNLTCIPNSPFTGFINGLLPVQLINGALDYIGIFQPYLATFGLNPFGQPVTYKLGFVVAIYIYGADANGCVLAVRSVVWETCFNTFGTFCENVIYGDTGWTICSQTSLNSGVWQGRPAYVPDQWNVGLFSIVAGNCSGGTGYNYYSQNNPPWVCIDTPGTCYTTNGGTFAFSSSSECALSLMLCEGSGSGEGPSGGSPICSTVECNGECLPSGLFGDFAITSGICAVAGGCTPATNNLAISNSSGTTWTSTGSVCVSGLVFSNLSLTFTCIGTTLLLTSGSVTVTCPDGSTHTVMLTGSGTANPVDITVSGVLSTPANCCNGSTVSITITESP